MDCAYSIAPGRHMGLKAVGCHLVSADTAGMAGIWTHTCPYNTAIVTDDSKRKNAYYNI